MKSSLLFLIGACIILTVASCNHSKSGQVQKNSSLALLDTIDTITAKRLVKNYERRAGRIHKGSLIMSNTRCVWFSVAQLKALINRIDTAHGGDGIRFYIAAYDSIPSAPDRKTRVLPSSYTNRNTLVMVPTKLKDEKQHVDDLSYKSGGIFRGKGGMVLAMPANRGELCPPPEKCFDEGALLLPNQL